MGLLMFLGMVGSIAYSGYAIKEETQAITIDHKNTPKYNTNKDNHYDEIKSNFISILKRNGIKYNNVTKNPTENYPNPCLAYLTSQGYKKNDLEYFKELFQQRYEKEQKIQKRTIKSKHRKILKQIENNNTKIYYTLQTKNYTRKNTLDKMSKIMENPLWSALVDNYASVPSGMHDIEVWNLYIPVELKHRNKLMDIYREVCKIEGIL